MKQPLLFCLLLCLLAGSTHAATYDVYIMAGQSNMDGRGDVADLEEPLKSPQQGALIFYTNPADPDKETYTKVSTGWQTLAPGYSIGPGARHKPLPSATFGPEVSFAGAMAKASGTENKIAIIKVSQGGTNLRSDWAPDGYMYQALAAEIGTAMTALAEQGDTATIKGMVWHQGESDGSDIENYQDNLEELIGNIRAVVKDEALPFVIGELAQTKPEAFRTMQKKIATDNDGVGFAASTGLNVIGGEDQTHLNSAAQIAMGERYAEAMATLVPEPNTLGLLGFGAVYVLHRRAR